MNYERFLIVSFRISLGYPLLCAFQVRTLFTCYHFSSQVTGSPQTLRKQYENELSNVRERHKQDLDRLREEHEDNTRIIRESVEEEFDQKLVAVMHEAKQVWEEEQEEERYFFSFPFFISFIVFFRLLSCFVVSYLRVLPFPLSFVALSFLSSLPSFP